ncbi:MAG: DUF4190 domain-containing protein [Candidatus Woesearchaeota archaeon]|jgi:TRAP-type C4-dicarboxylate transport system permease small subunit
MINSSPTQSASVQPASTSQAGPSVYEEKFHSEFSVVSFICGILGLILPLFSTMAIIFGIAGLMQTHREGMKGRWMAAVGIVLGIFGMILIIVAILFGFSFLETYLLRFGGIDTLIGKAHAYVNR